MKASYFEFYSAAKILFGEMAMEHLAHELYQLRVSKPLLLTDAVLARLGHLDILRNALAEGGMDDYELYSDIPVDSSLAKVNEMADVYRQSGCDGIIALGGGSVIDSAKGLRLLLMAGEADLMSLSGVEGLRAGALVPFVVIPTTAGTGSECTGVAVIKNDATGAKMEFVSPYVQPHAALIDPRMTVGLPPNATASTAMDALSHAIEAASCLQRNPLSQSYAHTAIRLISQNLLTVLDEPKNKGARAQMALASCFAGIAFSNSMVGLVHAIGHALGGLCQVPHAIAMGLLLPHVMRYNLEFCASYYAQLLPELIGWDAAAQIPHAQHAEATITGVASLLALLHERVGLPTKLRELSVEPDSFARIADMAVDDGALIVNPRDAGREEIIAILQQAY